MNLAVWYPASTLALLALALWWNEHGKAFLLRQKARRFGTCAGCGREKPSCSCQIFEFTAEEDDDE